MTAILFIDHAAYLFPGGQGGIGQDRGRPGRSGRLQLHPGTEKHRWAAVNEQVQAASSLIEKDLGNGPAATGGGAPVEIAELIAGLIGFSVMELHTLAAEESRQGSEALPAGRAPPALPLFQDIAAQLCQFLHV